MKAAELDIIYDFVDMYLRKGQYSLICECLRNLKERMYFEENDLDEVLAWLTITFPAKSQLSHYREDLLRLAKLTWTTQKLFDVL